MTKFKRKKRFGLVTLLNLSAITFIGLSSCSNKVVLSWTGIAKSYERNYNKYSKSSIRLSNVVNGYTNNKNFEKMLSQDIIYNMNYLCTLYDNKMPITYKVSSVSHSGHRLSYRIKMFNPDSELLLDISVQNLSYSDYYNTDSNEAMLIVSNSTYSSGSYILKPEFWLDDRFHVILLSYEEGSLDMNYDFCWKNFDNEERYKFADQFLPWLEITPYFYEGIQVES